MEKLSQGHSRQHEHATATKDQGGSSKYCLIFFYSITFNPCYLDIPYGFIKICLSIIENLCAMHFGCNLSHLVYQTRVPAANKWVPFDGTQNTIFRLSFKLNLPKIFLSEVRYDVIINTIFSYLAQIEKV